MILKADAEDKKNIHGDITPSAHFSRFSTTRLIYCLLNGTNSAYAP
jgi:hypothetical protein